jgi:hypothetical protein
MAAARAGHGWHDVRVEAAGWVGFRRADAGAVVAMVRAVAEAGDPGEHGDGVEVVVEAPRRGWLSRLFDRDGRPDHARIVVTKAGGEVGYPFDIQLVTNAGGRAARRVPVTPGWARSNSAGLAFVIQKGSAGRPYAWDELVAGAIGALSWQRRRRTPERGWRAAVDRSIRRE